MSEQWQYQIRIDVAEEHAEALRSRPEEPAVAPLVAMLRRHDAKAVCQYDAFAGYCAEAEREGIEEYPLYAWTKATIDDPVKKAKYLKSFTLYVDGDQVYPKAQAEALEAELRPLVGGGHRGQAPQVRHQPGQQPAAAGAACRVERRHPASARARLKRRSAAANSAAPMPAIASSCGQTMARPAPR